MFMFIDRVEVNVYGGNGGNGAATFHHEKFKPYGGPDGGDGGRGGSVIFEADPALHTLLDLSYRRHLKASSAVHGSGGNRHGANGEDLIVRVPVGTVVKSADGKKVFVDLSRKGQQVIVAYGGRGGRGNARFTGARRRAPRLAEKGEPGKSRTLVLELKLIADVGLLGLPNAGKSTFLSRITAAQPKIAGYPFTTLAPNLGVASVEDGESFVVADLPGLIAGAHQGKGLGYRFLRHVERTRLLLHIVDLFVSPVDALAQVEKEISLYSPQLVAKPRIIAGNKLDLSGASEALAALRDHVGEKGQVFGISAVTGEGIPALLESLGQRVKELAQQQERVDGEQAEWQAENQAAVEPIEALPEEDDGRLLIEGSSPVFVVRSKSIERLVAMTDFENEEACARFQRISKNTGLEKALLKKGIKEGDTVRIGKQELIYTSEGD